MSIRSAAVCVAGLLLGFAGPLQAQQRPGPTPAPAPAPVPPAARAATPAPAPAPAKGARLKGVVLNAEDGLPLGFADVVLVGLDLMIRTGTDGRFDFGALEPGTYIVQSRFLGFAPYTVRAELADSSSLDLVFRMKKQAVQLEEQTVVAEKEQKKGRFYERMKESGGFGSFLTREQIDERNTPFVCDLLRGRLGLRIIQNGSGCFLRFSRAQGSSLQNADCPPNVYLDGARVDISLVENNNLPPQNLEGVEIYRSSAEAPIELNNGNTCGVIALWSRTGR